MSAPSKCKVCDKTAYPLESISYDNMVYHKTCFKCLQCSSSVSLKKVAMIQGDLYCKNCFIRMFSEKGNYKVFAEKDKPSHSSQPSLDLGANDPALEAQATANYLMKKGRRGSIVTCLMDGCEKPRASGVNYCIEHQRSQNDDELSALLTAINEKNVKEVKSILQKDGVKLAVKPNSKRQTAVELAFTTGNNALGVVMVEMLGDRVNHLEEQLRILQEQMELMGPNAMLKLSRPRRNSAPKEQTENDDEDGETKNVKSSTPRPSVITHIAPSTSNQSISSDHSSKATEPVATEGDHSSKAAEPAATEGDHTAASTEHKP